MKELLTSSLLVGILLVVASWPTPVAADAQSVPAVENVAQRAADAVAKTHKQNVLVFGRVSCQLNMELCTAFEASFHDNINKNFPAIQFVKSEDVVSRASQDGFVALDVEVDDVLRALAQEVGAQILVTYGLEWQRDGYELSSQVFDIGKKKEVTQLRVKLAQAVPDSGGMPLAIKDPGTGVSLLVPRGKPPNSSSNWYPICEICPEPSYTPLARNNKAEGTVLILVTINAQGLAEHIDVINDLKGKLSEEAVKAVQNWRFKPALGADGKPLATRTPIVVTFRLF